MISVYSERVILNNYWLRDIDIDSIKLVFPTPGIPSIKIAFSKVIDLCSFNIFSCTREDFNEKLDKVMKLGGYESSKESYGI